jgi:short-subunit dehydrogenase
MTSLGVLLQPHAAWIAYACTKLAMNCLAAGLVKEEQKVSMLCVTPGNVHTAI